jgi:hypothetical protein
MNISVIRETLGALAIGIFWWGYFRYRHGVACPNSRGGYYFTTVPSWLATICGRPLPDNRLELFHMLGQIGGLLLSIIWLPMYWFGLDHSQRITAYAVCTICVLAIPIAAYIVVALRRRLR